jgi:hypothetical protein
MATPVRREESAERRGKLSVLSAKSCEVKHEASRHRNPVTQNDPNLSNPNPPFEGGNSGVMVCQFKLIGRMIKGLNDFNPSMDQASYI